jgi:hypothetical protein
MTMLRKFKIRLYCAIMVSICLPFHGCIVGTRGNIEANDLTAPVAFTYTIHDYAGNVIDERDYIVVSNFSFSYVQRGINYPLSIKHDRDISDELNRLIAEHNGDAIVGFTVVAENATGMNSLPIVAKSIGWMGVAGGLAMTGTWSSNGWSGPILLGSSLAVALFTPGYTNITVYGDIVRFR